MKGEDNLRCPFHGGFWDWCGCYLLSQSDRERRWALERQFKEETGKQARCYMKEYIPFESARWNAMKDYDPVWDEFAPSKKIDRETMASILEERVEDARVMIEPHEFNKPEEEERCVMRGPKP